MARNQDAALWTRDGHKSRNARQRSGAAGAGVRLSAIAVELIKHPTAQTVWPPPPIFAPAHSGSHCLNSR